MFSEKAKVRKNADPTSTVAQASPKDNPFILPPLSSALQQAEFAQKSMTSELQLVRNSSGVRSSEDASSSGPSSTSNAPATEQFHEEYQRLQAQFNEVMEQKSQLATQLTEAAHTIKQREARCQQLAMQVSQLAEDRGYLNTQLAHISKSLREKEQEWLAMRHQYSELYQAYLAAQGKTAELERRIALDSVQKELEDEETAAEADQIRGQTDQAVGRLEELQTAYQSLHDSHTTVSAVLSRERELREQLETELGQAQEHIKVLGASGSKEVKLQLEEESSRIRATTTMLTRHEMGYLNRLQSWIRVKKALSSRRLSRMIRLRPGIRTLVWGYFVLLHLLLIACFGGFL
ncbi:Golgin subfamily B member 1 isoform 1 [Elysia marginata]|uniref:Golgin subfamily B member 1 isoform 1 n=1 Tax=Elysia marginata TaxID=1093978 RepID=A0AAV4F172_9GAST|nr:Golgin subfamily B member 1 isoform 1 [Elysia marginata]